jgi:hypothetical protein
MTTLHVLVDDQRNFGDVIIRNPEHAVRIIRWMFSDITTLSMDNDMGGSVQGYEILEEILAFSKTHKKYIPTVNVVTGNIVAARRMSEDLTAAGYRLTGATRFTRKP